jgi:hypothetical protein
MGQYISKVVEYWGTRICKYDEDVIDLYEIEVPEYKLEYFEDKKFYTVKL